MRAKKASAACLPLPRPEFALYIPRVRVYPLDDHNITVPPLPPHHAAHCPAPVIQSSR